ncbi:hypothetical protein P8452_72988 [Trifolium repens]|nr:hypothetical protein QL285_047825 [Trifolium repens]WJX91171.1 hypothetical protein P8452_72988 [Trifolium repens]
MTAASVSGYLNELPSSSLRCRTTVSTAAIISNFTHFRVFNPKQHHCYFNLSPSLRFFRCQTNSGYWLLDTDTG